MIPEGMPFGHYRLLDLLGAGGMGQIFRAYDTHNNRVVAVKVLPGHSAEDEELRVRFAREARVASSLRNPHIVPINGFGEINGRLYLDMALVEGTDLQRVLRREPLGLERAVSTIAQVASALDAAHARGLVHRDIKPSNILVGADGTAFLIDFGIASIVGETKLTSTGAVIGTYAYLAPERYDEHTDPALERIESVKSADVYALACVLYECLTGVAPFLGNRFDELREAHQHTPPPLASLRRPDVPPALDAVIVTGMAKRPQDRFPSAGALADASTEAIESRHHRPTDAPVVANSRTAPTMLNSGAVPTVLNSDQHVIPTRVAPPRPFVPHPAPPSRHIPASQSRRPAVLAAVLVLATVITVAIGFSIWLNPAGGARDSDTTVAGDTGSPRGSTQSAPVVAPPAQPGQAWAWGGKNKGALGYAVDDTAGIATVPLPVSGLANVADMAVGYGTAYALSSDRTVWAWGSDEYGQLGPGRSDSPTPVRIDGLDDIIDIAAAGWTAYALRSDGAVLAWGWGQWGMLGDGKTGQDHRNERPTVINGLRNVRAIAAESRVAYALLSDGTVRSWGVGFQGGLGSGTRQDALVPVHVRGLRDIAVVAGGDDCAYAVTTEGTVLAWGRNDDGRLGPGTPSGDTDVPVAVAGLDGVVDIVGTYGVGYALRSDGTLWTWGTSNWGGLGNGPITSAPQLLQVRLPGTVISISAGGGTGYAVTADGSVWMWGDDMAASNEPYGNRAEPDRAIPTRVTGLSPASKVFGAYTTAYAVIR